MTIPTLRYLSRQDVESLAIGMEEIIDAVGAALRERGEGTAEMPPKPGVHPRKDAFIHAMPAFLEGMGAAGLKWVSGFPQNLEKGLPYISGLFVLNDVQTGLPLSVMDCTWITGARTGAASAVAAKYLARPESATIGIVACGLQGRTNLEAMACVFPWKRPSPTISIRRWRRPMQTKWGRSSAWRWCQWTAFEMRWRDWTWWSPAARF